MQRNVLHFPLKLVEQIRVPPKVSSSWMSGRVQVASFKLISFFNNTNILFCFFLYFHFAIEININLASSDLRSISNFTLKHFIAIFISYSLWIFFSGKKFFIRNYNLQRIFKHRKTSVNIIGQYSNNITFGQPVNLTVPHRMYWHCQFKSKTSFAFKTCHSLEYHSQDLYNVFYVFKPSNIYFTCKNNLLLADWSHEHTLVTGQL